MIWGWIESSHPEWATKGWARWWLRTPLWEKVVLWVLAFVVVGLVYVAMGAIQGAFWVGLGRVKVIGWVVRLFLSLLGLFQMITFLLLILALPFTIIDTWIDLSRVGTILEKTAESRGAILATRGEYIGGHPLLPEGRFLYLFLEGTLETPRLSLLVPQGRYRGVKEFTVPVLEVERTEERKEESLS